MLIRLSAIHGAAVAALVLTAAACSSTAGVPASQAAPVGGFAGQVPPLPPTQVKFGLETVSTSLGTVVTSEGFTLYRFDKDRTNPSTTTCVDACAEKWPPLLGDGVPALKGVRGELVGTVERPDGQSQLTLDGWPLYRFAQDSAPGDVNGEGVGGTWRAIGSDGKPVVAAGAPAAPQQEPAAPADSPPQDSAGTGY